MKISVALSRARELLAKDSIDSYKIDSLLLLCHVLSFSKEQIIFNPDLEINSAQEEQFFNLINRRLKCEPISHIIGQREFFGRDFIVNKNVLDPRPDSESLIELALEVFPDQKQQLKILELGVGSGCLIITLLNLYPNALGMGLDISSEALKVAQKNAVKNSVDDRLTLKESNLFSVLDGDKFDLIISNPPYINSEDIENLQPEVKIYEPRIALDGGKDGLDFYRLIAKNAASFLNKNGKIILEIGFGQKDEIIEIFNQFSFVKSKSDLGGVERILCFNV